MMRSVKLRMCGVILICGAMLAGCSSDSSTASSSSPPGGTTGTESSSTPASPSTSGGDTSVAVDGKWNGSYQPSGGGSGDFSVTFTQTGSSLDGTLSISVACLDGAKVTGKVNGDSIDFGSVQGQCSVDYKGTISGDQMSGTYGLGQGTAGTWKASKA
jgi:hypothetical protein